MPSKKDYTAAKKGMQRDKHPAESGKDEYSLMVNGNIQDEHGNGSILLQNEPSNILCSKFKEGYRVVGFKFDINANRTYFFLSNPTTHCSEIGYIDANYFADSLEAVEQQCGCNVSVVLETPLENTTQTETCAYNTIISDYCARLGSCTGCLNFSIYHPIHESNIELKDELLGKVLYWTDGYNPPRYLQLNNLEIYTESQEGCEEPETVCFDCDKLRIFKKFNKPCLTPRIIQNGGNLKAGVYEMLICYSDTNFQSLSSYYSITNPITIHDKNNNVLDDTNLDYLTNQAISLSVSGLDNKYTHFKIAVIYTSGLDSSVTLVDYDIYPIDSTEITIATLVNTSNTNVRKPITFQDLYAKVPYYVRSQGLTAANGYLFQYGMETQREINLQPVVNLMGAFARWITYQANEDLYDNGVYVANYMSYMRDEVVPFGIKFYGKGGYETAIFPFIARPSIGNEKDILGSGAYPSNINTQSVLAYNPDCTEDLRNERWQFENTAEVLNNCPSGTGVGTVTSEREVEKSCTVSDEEGNPESVAIIASSEFEVTTDLDLVTYINQNTQVIIDSTGPNGADIRDILSDPAQFEESCEVNFPSYCDGEPMLLRENIFAISVDSQETVKEPLEFGDYERVLPPQTCNTYQLDNNGNIVVDQPFINNYMNPTEVVYKRSPIPNNLVCSSAIPISVFVNPQVDNFQYLIPKGETGGGYSTLQTSINVTTTATGFTNKLHANPIWYKLDFASRDQVIIELSSIQCQNPDDNSGTQIRVSFFDSCGSTSDISTYGRIITTATTNDPDKFIQLNASDFSTQFAYIAIDSPIRQRTLDNSTEVATLTPPCGCFSIYQRDVEYLTKITYTNLKFGKKQTYSEICTFTVPNLNGCDPQPYQTGLFSYWQSAERYPCNKELWNSNTLSISPDDIPTDYQEEFEGYYTSGTSGGNYVLVNADFQEQPIRHFKFPDNKVSPFISFDSDQASQNPGNFNDSIIYPIGFYLDNEVVSAFLDVAVKNNLLTNKERFDLTDYEIYRGDRRTNKSVIAKGLLFDMYMYRQKEKDVYYPNYPLNSLGFDEFNGLVPHPYQSLSNNMFTFHSPEIHFDKPSLTREMAVEGYMYGAAGVYFDEVRNHSTWVILGSKAYNLANALAIAEVTFELLTQLTDYAITAATGSYGLAVAIALAVAAVAAITSGIVFKRGQYYYQWIDTFKNFGEPKNFAYYSAAIGHYNYFAPNNVLDSTLRGISSSTYLKAGRVSLKDETNSEAFNINNFNREDSVAIRTGAPQYRVNYPSDYVDFATSVSSRMHYPDVGASTRNIRNAASPYVSLKQYLPSQYGSINSVSWMNTGYCGNTDDINECQGVFGGDTYISRFALKRKFPFFTANAYGLAPRIPFKYSRYFNVNPDNFNIGRYYCDYDVNSDDYNYSVGDFLFPDQRTDYGHLDELDSSKFYIQPPSKFYLFSYGFPYYLVESTINCGYRYAKPALKYDFYPNQQDVIELTQEQNVSINEPNTYFYNHVYSKGHSLSPDEILPSNYSAKLRQNINNQLNTIIYSLQDVEERSLTDPWLNYKPLDTFTFPTSNGRIIDVTGIESDQVLGRFTNGLTIFGAVDNLADRITPETQKLGIGGIFTVRSLSFNKTDLGYAGTQNRALVSCDYGHFWADAKRGKVFNLQSNAAGLKEISHGLEKWFKENLPFKILNQFPTFNIDNPYNGVGLTMGWDDRLKRLFITKKDYINTQDVEYSDDGYFYTGSGTCPTGYTLQDGVCVKIETAPKEPNGDPFDTIMAGNSAHGYDQPALYDDYNPDGTANVDGTYPTGYTYLNLSAPFWTGNGSVPNRLTSKFGRWINGGLGQIWYGGSSVIEVPSTQTYYVALAADNFFRFSVDGSVILESDRDLMGPQHISNPSLYTSVPFRKVHIYPITLAAGCHTVRVEGMNEDDFSDAMFGAAILNNTRQELMDATSYVDLNYIYTTETEDVFYEESTEYVCPAGYIELGSTACDDCQKIDTIEPDYTIIELSNPDYFKECSWTVAYSPLTDNWISYYSFLPNYYISYHNYFQTGVNVTNNSSEFGLWSHFSFLSSYQVFYGKLYPWLVEYTNTANYTVSNMEYIEYWMDVRKYYNKYDFADIPNIGFNKGYIFNNFQNSGLLNLVPQEKNNLYQSIQYPKHNPNSTDILQTEENGKYTFNYFYNMIRNEKSGLPVWKYDCPQIMKTISEELMDYRPNIKDRIRGDYYQTMLINDKESRYKMILRLSIESRNNY